MDKFAQFDSVFDKQAQMTEETPMAFKNPDQDQGAVPRTSFHDVLTSIYQKRLALRQYKMMLYRDLKAFSSTDLSLQYLKTRRKERRNLKHAVRDFFLQKFTVINIMRAKFGYRKLNSSIIADFESAIEFDYILIF
jgi:hypothetical protein